MISIKQEMTLYMLTVVYTMKAKIIHKKLTILTAITVIGMALSGCGGQPSGTSGSESSQDVNTDFNDTAEVDQEGSSLAADPYSARSVVDDMVFGISIGNTLDAYSNDDSLNGVFRNDGPETETCWGNPVISQAYIDALKDSGINVIRIPVTWYTHTDPNTYMIDEAWLDRVKETVDYAIDDDTYVIINLHHDTGTDGWLHASKNDLDKKEEIFKSFWAQIAAYFSDYDGHLLFESFNEILNDQNEWNNPDSASVSIVNELNQEFVDTVRATGGNNSERVLIINPYCAGVGTKMLEGFTIPTDVKEDGLIAEVHGYRPYRFTAPEYPNDTSWEESDIDDMLKYVNNTFSELDVPVIIGEFGACPKDNDDALISWASYYISSAKDYGIKCCWWDNGTEAEYGIFDRNTGTALKPELVSAMLEAAGNN